MSSKFDALIRNIVVSRFPAILEDFGPSGWLWIKAQMWKESAFKPMAKSDKGAMGLLQILPSTWAWLKGGDNPFDPEQNIRVGVGFMDSLYEDFTELPDPAERMKAALASYNGGKGYTNVALALAREDEGLPFGFSAWKKAGRPAGAWQKFDTWGPLLADPRCKVSVKGKMLRPDHKQIQDYVVKICNRHASYANHGGAS